MDRPKYFTGGIQFGLALNTIYRYTDDLGFFEEFNYGKKLTGTFGIIVNRDLSNKFNLETGLFYYKRGTKYKLNTIYERGKYTRSQGVDIHYIGFPIILNQLKQGTANSVYYRYGIDIAYKFAINVPQIDYSSEGIYKDYDFEGLIGMKFNAKNPNFFKNKTVVVDFMFSLIPIFNKEYIDVLESAREFNVLPNQRNFSLTISIQHIFK